MERIEDCEMHIVIFRIGMLDNFLIQITIFFLENKTPGKAWYFKISQKRLDISTDCFWAPQKSYKDNVWKFPDNYNKGYFQ